MAIEQMVHAGEVTADKLPDVWSTRDYPVLKETCRLIDSGDLAMRWDLAKATGLSEADISLAFAALQRQGYVTSVDNRGGMIVGITGVNGEAYRVVGLHPDPHQNLADLLVERLLAAAEETTNETDKSKLRKAADLLGDVTKNVTAGVVSGLITSGITG